MKKLTLLLPVLVALAGCVPHDQFDNPVWLGRHAEGFTFQPVQQYVTDNVEGWCHLNKGTLTADHQGCVWTWTAMRENKLPCIEAFKPGLDGDRLKSDKRFLDDVCNGFMPQPGVHA